MPSRGSLVCLAIGIALFAYGLIDGIVATSAYQVGFIDGPTRCSGNAGIVLDVHTGSRTTCIGEGGKVVEGGYSPFSAEEEKSILDLAKRLGSDGLSTQDRAEIEQLVASIAAANGDPVESGSRAGSPGQIAILVGCPLLVIAVFWVPISWLHRSD